MRSIIGVKDCSRRDMIADSGKGSILGLEYEGKASSVTLAHDHDTAAFTVLIDSEAAVPAIDLPICGLHVSAKICAVNFNRLAIAADFANALGCDGFADFVCQDESRLVLAIQIAGELKG